jgi:hypothetical protein
LSEAIKVVYSSPIGPKLGALTETKQAQFREMLMGLLENLSPDGQTMGCMVSNVLSAEKA